MIALLCFLAGTPLLTVPVAALADERVTGVEQTASARLVWPAGTRVDARDEDGELVVRFDRALPPAAIDAFRDGGGAAIGDLRWNDESLVLRAASGWTLDWRAGRDDVTVRFVPAAPDRVAAPRSDGGREAELALVQADIASGYPGQARRRAERLAARDPGDTQAARMLADARQADGDWRGAARDYRVLKATDRSARRAMAASGGTVSLGATARDGGDLSQVETALRADVPVGERIVVGGAVRHIASWVDTGRRTVRTGEPVLDAGATIAIDTTARASLVASTALDTGVTGGGARIVAGSIERQVRASATYRMPDYSTIQQVLAGGHLSRATLGATWRLAPGLVGQADLGWNRYGLVGVGGAGDTLTLAGGADYLIRRQFPALGLSYRVEAEYVQHLRRAIDGSALIPLVDRENHTLQAMISDSLGAVQLTGLAGWTVDRFGGDGPNASIGVAAPIGVAWRIEGSGGITSIARQGFSGRQLFARAQLSRSLGDAR